MAEFVLPSLSDTAETPPSLVDSSSTLTVVDHAGNSYAIPWKQASDYTRFKAYAEEIYARKGDDQSLEQIRDDRFDVSIEIGVREHRIVLPSLWDALVREGGTARISFWHDSRKPYPVPEQSLSSADNPLEVIGAENDTSDSFQQSSDDETDAPRSVKRLSDSGLSIRSASDDTEGNWSSSEDWYSRDASHHVPPPQPVRAVIKPLDEEGNPLSFDIDTSWATESLLESKDYTNEVIQSRIMTLQTLRITKAVAFTHETRTILEVHTLPGPESTAFASSVKIRWYHMYGDQLDWAQFKSNCLTLPSLSERTRLIVKKILLKIEKDKIKAFLGGMFIEPGTVIRGDEYHQSSSQSIIFSCIPYLDIQKPLTMSTQNDRLYPPRTLMQSNYPYEPVRERDGEQAYKRFGNGRSGDLIHVPTLWMLNVNDQAVITCSHSPLSSDFTNSIKIVEDDLKQLGPSKENRLTTIRLIDSEGRVMLYSLEECSTYFQMEQRVREMRRSSGRSRDTKTPALVYHGQEEVVKASPASWPSIVQQKHMIFIDLSEGKDPPEKLPETLSSRVLGPMKGSVPPFFHWPLARKGSKEKSAKEDLKLSSMDFEQSTRCIEQVEKSMLNETLPEYDTGGPVDRTFTSTDYYASITEHTFKHVEQSLLSLIRRQNSLEMSNSTHHQFIVRALLIQLPDKAYELTRIAHNTLMLYLGDYESCGILHKFWGAMNMVIEVIKWAQQLSACNFGPEEFSDPTWKTPKTRTRSWRIRVAPSSYTYANQGEAKLSLPLPNDDVDLGATLKKCKKCAHEAAFDNPSDALAHLKKHIRAEPAKQDQSTSSSLVQDDGKLTDWIRNDDQALLESTLAGACAILDRATDQARDIHNQLRELADGVRDEGGSLSKLYTFPHKMVETLHRLIVFYLAVERSLHYTKEDYVKTKKGGPPEDFPYTKPGLEVIDRFSDGVKTPLLMVRDELCEMVRSRTPNDHLDRMSWGPESISTWLMRRLIVKPLEKSMTAGDMYREYLTALQFQVNHRPGKRLLRSINLLQEELTILAKLTEQQAQLVRNFTSVLDDSTYPVDHPSRRSLFPTEKLVLTSCLDYLAITREEYEEQIRRCGPLLETTKQSSEINEEDHGKAILVFTVVTVIFLPLSFVTSYLGMNTSDIRDMDNKQSLFWEIALPLTVGVMAVMMAIAYNGDEIRDASSFVWRRMTGKQDRNLGTRGIGVLQRKRATIYDARESASTLTTAADDAEYAAPKPKVDYWYDTTMYNKSHRPKALQKPSTDYPSARHLPVRSRMNYEPIQRQIPTSRVARFSQTKHAPNVTIYNSARVPPHPITVDPTSQIESHVESATRKRSRSPPRRSSYLDTNAVLPRAHRPTYTRINTRYADPAVLDEQNLRWSYDPQDADFVIIQCEPDSVEMEIVTLRTQMMRENGRRVGDTASGKGEYQWISKKDRRTERRGRNRRAPPGWGLD